MEIRCPACGEPSVALAVTAARAKREIRLRSEFVFARLGRKAAPGELKDLTEFMHGFPAPIAGCPRCGTLIRGERNLRAAESYENDPNDADLMEQLFPRYVEAFRRKEPLYRPLLRPRADVLEIGSHLGGFLQTAEEWNWNPVALDVGRDTAEFSKRRGFKVARSVLQDSAIQAGSMEAVFVWNCFEQIPDPSCTLRAIRGVLRRHGLIVVRVPNALFYRVVAERIPDRLAVGALAYNNLLGFPYLYGYSAQSLNRLISAHGFKRLRDANSELITIPFPELTRRMEEEQRAVRRAVAIWSARLAGPWIEIAYRKLN